MSQLTFGDAEYAGKRKTTRREVFLAEMDQVVPWKSLLGLIEPFYPLAGRGRQPYPLETMLRVHLMQNWFGLSDPGMEEALYEVASMRQFARLTLLGAIPDESTILHFRHLLEQNEIAPQILERVNAHLNRKGLLLKRGTMVDATIIEAPSSTKNASGERDPEMHQTKKGKRLALRDEGAHRRRRRLGAGAYGGDHPGQRIGRGASRPAAARQRKSGAWRCRLHRCRGACPEGQGGLADRAQARAGQQDRQCQGAGPRPSAKSERKAQIRARVEHPFRVIKRQFGYMKVRFKGLMKNTAQVVTLFALANLYLARKRLMAA